MSETQTATITFFQLKLPSKSMESIIESIEIITTFEDAHVNQDTNSNSSSSSNDDAYSNTNEGVINSTEKSLQRRKRKKFMDIPDVSSLNH